MRIDFVIDVLSTPALAEHVDGRRFEFSADYARDANLRVGRIPIVISF